jgi:predicted transcriptional regulator
MSEITEQYLLRLSPSDADLVRLQAAREQRPRSDVIRAAIRAYVAANEKTYAEAT